LFDILKRILLSMKKLTIREMAKKLTQKEQHDEQNRRRIQSQEKYLAHVTPGELVIPVALQTPEVMAAVDWVAAGFGIPLDRLRVGARSNSINPQTGAPEFFLEGLRNWLSSNFGSKENSQPSVEPITIVGKPTVERLDVRPTPSAPQIDDIPIVGRVVTSDPRTNERILKLHPAIHRDAARMVNEVRDEIGTNLRISDAYRTDAEQDALYAQGRTKPGKIVTNARGGESYHNYGLAYDVVGLDGSGINYNIDYPRIAEIAKKYGFTWGGDWSTPDKPHFERTYGHSTDGLSRLRPPSSVYPKLP